MGLLALKLSALPILYNSFTLLRGNISPGETVVDCIFCKIINGDMPTPLSYQNEHLIAFQDIRPQAPHHLLIVPRKHISTLNDLVKDDSILLGHMVESASLLAKQLGISDHGYRVVMNCNAGAGQTVFHIHLHLLGGRAMTWPPG